MTPENDSDIAAEAANDAVDASRVGSVHDHPPLFWIDPSDPLKGDRYAPTHPHLIHIYSEVDELDHAFRVTDRTMLRKVMDEFYAVTKQHPSPLDRFKCETNGEDLLDHDSLTIAQLRSASVCNSLTWIFTNRPIRIYVDTQPKEWKEKKICFKEVVTLAYDNNPPQGDNWRFTVGYTHGPRANIEGSLTKGHCIKIKDGMRFDVSATQES